MLTSQPMLEDDEDDDNEVNPNLYWGGAVFLLLFTKNVDARLLKRCDFYY